jgi:hypothetical protein
MSFYEQSPLFRSFPIDRKGATSPSLVVSLPINRETTKDFSTFERKNSLQL